MPDVAPTRADEIFSICPSRLTCTRMLTVTWFATAHIAVRSNCLGHGYSSNGAFTNRSTVEMGL